MKTIHKLTKATTVVFLLFVALSSCKKNKPAPVGPDKEQNTKQTPTTNRRDLTNDSLFLYAKEMYFWNTSLPDYDTFEPRQYKARGADLDNYEDNLFNLVKSSGSPDYVEDSSYPKYSYIDDITLRNPEATAYVPNASASVDLEGNGNDIGIYAISAIMTDNVSYKLYILAVSQNSPADHSGLTRGCYITKINGSSIGSIADFDTRERDIINSTIYGDPQQLVLEGIKTDGTNFSTTLSKTSYKSSPIYKTNVLTAGSKEIGYLAYARFSNETNSVAALDAAFTDFASKGVTDLIVDLRYNGGGYVSTAEHLVNLIAPSTATGIMYVEHFNEHLKTRKSTDRTILSNQPLLDAEEKLQYKNNKLVTYADIDYSEAENTRQFSKAGTLNSVQNIVFIVSGNTASASELVINSLKPKMNVKLVGTTTYGKPVGFFPIRLENRYDVYMALFETKNSLNQGGYYNGMTPDVAGGTDAGDYDFGNPLDGYLKKALNILAPSVPVTGMASRNKLMSVSAGKGNASDSKLIGTFDNAKEFVGMIETRHRVKR